MSLHRKTVLWPEGDRVREAAPQTPRLEADLVLEWEVPWLEALQSTRTPTPLPAL